MVLLAALNEFQFHKVQLKDNQKTIESHKKMQFQFHKVQLKDGVTKADVGLSNVFQFHKVQLKAVQAPVLGRGCCVVSIP